MGKRDKEELDELTDEEREAIEGSDDDEAAADAKDEASAAEVAAAVAAAEKGEDKSEDGESSKGEGKTEAKAEKAADEAEGEDEPEPVARAAAPKWAAPEDADAKLADISKREDDLAEQFDNGDITAKELTAGMRDLAKERFDLQMAVEKATMAEEIQQSAYEERKAIWFRDTVPAFLKENPAYQYNKDDPDADPTLNRTLDAQVRHLQVEAEEAGRDPFSPQILAEAHRRIRALAAKLAGTEIPEAKAKKDLPKRPAAPQTLAKVPAADLEDTDGNEFAALDRLADQNPEGFEDALAKLPDSARERYLSSTH